MSFYTEGGLRERSQLAVLFAEALEEFSVSEGSLGNLYLILNSQRPADAYRELEKNINYSQRIKLIRQRLDSLSQSERALILAVTDRASQAAGMRNKIAHCAWGYSTSLPDAVLQIPSSAQLKNTRERLKERLNLPATFESAEIAVMVYEARDFVAVRNAAIEATAPLDLACEYLMNQGESREGIMSQILSDPQTNQRYRKRLNEQQKYNHPCSALLSTFLSNIGKFVNRIGRRT